MTYSLVLVCLVAFTEGRKAWRVTAMQARPDAGRLTILCPTKRAGRSYTVRYNVGGHLYPIGPVPLQPLPVGTVPT